MTAPSLPADAMAAAMGLDKKRDAAGLRFIVPVPGGCAVLTGVEARSALELLAPASSAGAH